DAAVSPAAAEPARMRQARTAIARIAAVYPIAPCPAINRDRRHRSWKPQRRFATPPKPLGEGSKHATWVASTADDQLPDRRRDAAAGDGPAVPQRRPPPQAAARDAVDRAGDPRRTCSDDVRHRPALPADARGQPRPAGDRDGG